MGDNKKIHVGLFVTCLVDAMRPSIGFATIKLLEDAGCDISVPEAQTCCGQPAYNSGDEQGAREIAQQVIDAFLEFDYVVLPSGSCASTIKTYYPKLFENDAVYTERAKALSDKTWELLSFLTDVCDYQPSDVELKGSYTYHDSCSGLRELNIYQQPRQLLEGVSHFEYREMKESTECCGFGGLFCVKYADISNAIVSEKTGNIQATNADYLLGGDWGCLMNMSGKLHREGSTIKVLHAAEVLADMVEDV